MCQHENVFKVHLWPVENDPSLKPRCGKDTADSLLLVKTLLAFEAYIFCSDTDYCFNEHGFLIHKEKCRFYDRRT